MAFDGHGLFIGDPSVNASLSSDKSFKQKLKSFGIYNMKESFHNANWKTAISFAQAAGTNIEDVSESRWDDTIARSLFPEWYVSSTWWEEDPVGLPNVRALWVDCSQAWIADVRSRYSLTPGQRLIHYEYANVEREVRRDRFKERYQYTLFGVTDGELGPPWTAEDAFHKSLQNDRLGPYFPPRYSSTLDH